MSWIDKAERKYGRFAIQRIVRPVIGFQVLVYLLIATTGGFMWVTEGDYRQFVPDSLEAKLILDPVAVLNGEVWRLFTFLFLPPTWNPLWFMIGVMFMLFVSESLESLWGAFRMNVYVLSGMLFMMFGAFLLLLSLGPSSSVFASEYANSGALELSIFLAFAVLFPNYEILAMMVVPIKAKWLGWIAGGFVFFRYIDTKMAIGRVLIIVGLMNFFILALPRAISAYRQRADIAVRRRRFEGEKLPRVETFHECTSCGKSEVDDRDLEFRVTENGKEYCVPCLEKVRAAEEEKKQEPNPDQSAGAQEN